MQLFILLIYAPALLIANRIRMGSIVMIILGIEHIFTLYFEEAVQSRQPENDNVPPVTMAEFHPDKDEFPAGLLTLY